MISLIETPTRLIVTGEEKPLATLRQAFRFHPLNYFRADSYQLWKVTAGKKGWDGYVYPLALKTCTAGEILRGRKDELLAWCAQYGYEVDSERLIRSPFEDLTAEGVTDDLITSDFQLDPRQKEAVVEWLKHGMGVAHLPVNAGKSACFAAAAALIKKKYPDARFLYFTFTERLVRQVFHCMKGFLPRWDITQYGGGGAKDRSGKDMIVATQAMLNRNFRELEKENFFRTFLALLLDESHHLSSPTAERVLRASAAYFRLGGSDSTKEKNPDRWNKILGLCGPVRITAANIELIEEGRSAAPTLYLVDVPEWKGRFRGLSHVAEPGNPALTLVDSQWVPGIYQGPIYEFGADGKPVTKMQSRLEGDKWVKELVPVTVPSRHIMEIDGKNYEVEARFTLLDRRYDNAIIRFDERNQLIADWAKYYSSQGKPTLIVATRTPHVLILEALLRQRMGMDANKVCMLFGDDTTARRNKVFAWFKSVPGAVLISPLVKEGVSINELRAGVIADPVVDFEVARQIIGRFMRQKATSNVCELTWFIDRQHPRYQANVVKLIEDLSTIEGFTFKHPVIGPDTIAQAKTYHGKPPQRGERYARTRSNQAV